MGREKGVPPLEPETFGAGTPVEHSCREGIPRRPRLWKPFNPLGLPAPLTWVQCFYIWVVQGIGAAAIDGAANFGIACAMYRTGADPISMWKLSENTVAGDLAVTVFIQGTLTYIIAGSMVHVDMRSGKVAAFPFPWPDTRFAVVDFEAPETAQTRRGKLWRMFHRRHGLGRGLHLFSGSDTNDLFNFNLPSFKDWLYRLVVTVTSGLVLSALYFLVLWPIAIAIVAPIWGGRNMAHSWTAPLIKLVFGAVLGLLMNPIVACIALGSEDAVRVHRREVHAHNVQATLDNVAPAPNTAAERPTTRGKRAFSTNAAW